MSPWLGDFSREVAQPPDLVLPILVSSHLKKLEDRPEIAPGIPLKNIPNVPSNSAIKVSLWPKNPLSDGEVLTGNLCIMSENSSKSGWENIGDQ